MCYLEIPEIKFHGLRHSFATRCIESNCDYKTVSVLARTFQHQYNFKFVCSPQYGTEKESH